MCLSKQRRKGSEKVLYSYAVGDFFKMVLPLRLLSLVLVSACKSLNAVLNTADHLELSWFPVLSVLASPLRKHEWPAAPSIFTIAL